MVDVVDEVDEVDEVDADVDVEAGTVVGGTVDATETMAATDVAVSLAGTEARPSFEPEHAADTISALRATAQRIRSAYELRSAATWNSLP